MIQYTGFIRRVLYYSDTTHYIVALLDVEEESKVFTMNGYMMNYSEHDKYVFYGDYVVHPKYGQQFKLDHYEVVLADDKEEIIKYLSSPLFPGIGKIQATHIVETLGKNCLGKIKEDKHCLDIVKGMSETKRDTIYDVLKNQNYDQEVLDFFMGQGIPMRFLGIIQSTYKEKTLDILQNNPYQLIEDIDGIGFKSADDLALKIGCSYDDPNRIKAGIIYSIKQTCFSMGCTYLTYPEIKKGFYKIIKQIPDDLFDVYLEELIDEQKVIVENNKYYEHDLYCSEEDIVSFLKKIEAYIDDYDEDEVNRLLDNYQKMYEITYSNKQKEAIYSFLKNPIMILTGGPGTGKTTSVKAIIQIYHTLYPEEQISLLAPTGRASKRLTELTGLQACTIHRELKWDLHTNTFAVNEDNPLNSDVIIIDEFSMVDSLLLSHLFKAAKRCHKILFIGDYHQLPSVGPGNVLKDFIDAGVFMVELDEIYRQSQDSGIVQLAHTINHDEFNNLEIFKQYKDIHFYYSSKLEMIENVTKIARLAIENGYGLDDIQVLAPMYQGVAGIDALNMALQELFNPSKGQLEHRVGKKVFREGDKILQLKNRPEDDVYNGDIGILVEICPKDNFEYLEDTFIVDFDGNMVEYTSKDFYTITHAYCMSIHKAQGNEFKIVIMCVLKDYYIMLKRNLLYTGLTRAKQSLFILGSDEALFYGINNSSDSARKTTLSSKINEKEELSVYDFMD